MLLLSPEPPRSTNLHKIKNVISSIKRMEIKKSVEEGSDRCGGVQHRRRPGIVQISSLYKRDESGC